MSTKKPVASYANAESIILDDVQRASRSELHSMFLHGVDEFLSDNPDWDTLVVNEQIARWEDANTNEDVMLDCFESYVTHDINWLEVLDFKNSPLTEDEFRAELWPCVHDDLLDTIMAHVFTVVDDQKYKWFKVYYFTHPVFGGSDA